MHAHKYAPILLQICRSKLQARLPPMRRRPLNISPHAGHAGHTVHAVHCLTSHRQGVRPAIRNQTRLLIHPKRFVDSLCMLAQRLIDCGLPPERRLEPGKMSAAGPNRSGLLLYPNRFVNRTFMSVCTATDRLRTATGPRTGTGEDVSGRLRERPKTRHCATALPPDSTAARPTTARGSSDINPAVRPTQQDDSWHGGDTWHQDNTAARAPTARTPLNISPAVRHIDRGDSWQDGDTWQQQDATLQAVVFPEGAPSDRYALGLGPAVGPTDRGDSWQDGDTW